MLSSSALCAVLGSGVDNRDHDAVRSFIREACKVGLSLLLINPGSKTPFDGRTVKQRIADDAAAQETARQDGRRDYSRVKSASGLSLATTDSRVLLRKNGYLDAYITAFGPDCAVNLAVEVGGSRLIVVDCDTEPQKNRFIEEACTDAGIDPDYSLTPTVISPGTQDAEGNWIHTPGNGHFWFTVPEGVGLPVNAGAMTWGGEDGFAVLWRNRYALIPPSTRKEGGYELAGRDYEAPPWLLRAIENHATARASRYLDNTERDEDLASEIDKWAETLSWADILEPLGWEQVSRPDNCGCDVWTAPGAHASPKSATAHDAGCTLGRYTETNAPLHIWTDHDIEPFDEYVNAPGGSKTMSKLQAVAHAQYGGSIGKAMDELDLATPLTSIERDEGLTKANLADPDSRFDVAADFDVVPTDPHPAADEDEEDDDGHNPDVFDTGISGVPVIAPFSHWRHMPPPEYVIEGLIEHTGLSAIIGPPGVGKALSLDTPLPTPTGWTTMGEVQPGDLLLGRDGLPTAVRAATDVMYGRPCYEVEFSDGSVIVADAEHQWRTSTVYQRGPKSKKLQGGEVVDTIRTTEQIAATLIAESKTNHSVATTAPVRFPDADLPIAPYTLGAWLGDGTSSSNGLTSADPELVDRIRADGYEIKHHGVYRYAIFTKHDAADGPQPREDTFTATLRRAGVLNDKHIPSQFLRASESQRRALLAGLLDTDGTATNGSAQLCTTRQRLMEGAYELIVSLGYRCHVSSKVVKGRTPESSVAWTLMFAAADAPVFELSRKRDKMAASREGRTASRTNIRFITDVRPITSVPVRCVEVNNDEHMYLAGRSMIPTHNSSVALDMACHIATGKPWQGRRTLKTKVLYLPGEGLSGAVQRIKAWGFEHGVSDELLDEGLRMGNSIIGLKASPEAWGLIGDYINREQIGLVIFDTFARMAAGVDENSATEVGLAVKRFDRLRQLTNAGVLVVHHTAKHNPTSARGSSALMGALDSELLVAEGLWALGAEELPSGKPIQLSTTKQKNAEQLEDPISLLMRSCTEHPAPYITGPSGTTDPMAGDVVLASPVDEPVLETAIRIALFADDFPEQGVSRSESVAGVRPDPYTARRRDAAKAWKQKVGMAVDIGLRFGLLETVSGQRTGSRYVRGTVTPEAARSAHAAEVMGTGDGEQW